MYSKNVHRLFSFFLLGGGQKRSFPYSYTQGMSDLLAPVLCEINNESEAFWCFVGLMHRAIFVCTPTDNDIDKNLVGILKFINFYCKKFI